MTRMCCRAPRSARPRSPGRQLRRGRAPEHQHWRNAEQSPNEPRHLERWPRLLSLGGILRGFETRPWHRRCHLTAQRPMLSRVRTRISPAACVVILLITAVGGLLYVKWLPYAHRAATAYTTHSIGHSILTAGAAQA